MSKNEHFLRKPNFERQNPTEPIFWPSFTPCKTISKMERLRK